MHRLLSNRHIAFWLSFSALLTTSCTSRLVDRVQAMAQAHNRHDVDNEIRFYTDDARFEMAGRWTRQGTDQLRQMLDMDAALNSYLTYTFCEVRGNTVTCRVREENDLLSAAGIEAIYYESVAHVFDGWFIKEVKVKQTPESQRLLQETMESFSQWASEKQSQQWAALRAQGQNITKDNLDIWLALLRQWREETAQQEP